MKNEVISKIPALIKMSCHKVIPMPETTGVRVSRKELIAAIRAENIAYPRRVTE
jgi:hypothetical protein